MSRTTSFHSDQAVELDAGAAPEAQLLLATPSPSVRRELAVYRDSADGRTLRIVETEHAPGGIERIVRFLNRGEDGVVPLYTLKTAAQSEWNVEVGYGKGTSRVAYNFQQRRDALHFQRILTGYETRHCFVNVSFSIILKSEGLLRLGQRPSYTGTGEAQLWWPTSGQKMAASPASPTSSRSSSQEQSMRSQVVRVSDVVSLQTHPDRDETALTSELPPPPMLVAFLKDERGYTMLKTDVSRAEIKGSKDRDERIHLVASQRHKFVIEAHSVAKDDLGSWNILAFNTKGSAVTPLRWEFLTLDFATPQAANAFCTAFMDLGDEYLEMEREKRRVKVNVDQGGLPLSPIQNASKRMSWTSLIPHRLQRFSSFRSLPHITEDESFGEEVMRELDSERRTSELE